MTDWKDRAEKAEAKVKELEGLCSRLTDSWGEQIDRVKELQAEGTGTMRFVVSFRKQQRRKAGL